MFGGLVESSSLSQNWRRLWSCSLSDLRVSENAEFLLDYVPRFLSECTKEQHARHHMVSACRKTSHLETDAWIARPVSSGRVYTPSAALLSSLSLCETSSSCISKAIFQKLRVFFASSSERKMPNQQPCPSVLSLLFFSLEINAQDAHVCCFLRRAAPTKFKQCATL